MSDPRGTDESDDRDWDDPPGVEWGKPDEEEAGALGVATEGGLGGGGREPLTPGDVDPENALFVLLGAAATVLVLLQLFI